MEWFADSAVRLGLPAGDFYRRLYAFLPWWLLAGVGCGAVAAAAWRLLRDRLRGWVAAGTQRAVSGRDAAALTVFCVALILCFDGPGLVHGFFRQDDFSFLQVAREPLPLAGQMRLYHNDHAYPLYRVQVRALVGLAGPEASAGQLAAWFNAVTFLGCTGVLLAGAWVLHEAGVCRLGLGVFCFVAWTWPGWGEFTAGFYTLGVYVQVLALGLAAVAASLRGFRLNSVPWLAASLACAALAVGLNISGLWVFAALGAFTLFGRWPLATPSSRGYAAALAVVAGVAACVLLVAFKHPLSARELVQNPGGHGFPTGESIGQHWPAMLLALPSALGGALLGLVVPTFLQLGADQVAGNAILRGSIRLAELAAVLGAGGWVWTQRTRLGTSGPGIFLAAVAAAVTGVALVLAARTAYAVRLPGTLWHAKYLVGVVVWLVLAGTLLADRWWFAPPAPRLAPGVFAVMCLGLWLTASQQVWERKLLPMPLAYSARGRWGNVENAVLRRQQYERVMADLQALAQATGSTKLALPEPSWGPAFFERYPLLEWGSDHTPRGVTHLFADLPAASPGLGLRLEWRPAASFSPDEQRLLQRCAWLQAPAANP